MQMLLQLRSTFSESNDVQDVIPCNGPDWITPVYGKSKFNNIVIIWFPVKYGSHWEESTQKMRWVHFSAEAGFLMAWVSPWMIMPCWLRIKRSKELLLKPNFPVLTLRLLMLEEQRCFRDWSTVMSIWSTAEKPIQEQRWWNWNPARLWWEPLRMPSKAFPGGPLP